MFFRLRQASLLALLLILLIQLVFSPLVYTLTFTQDSAQKIANQDIAKGSLASKSEPFFVSQKLAEPHQYPVLARELKRVAESAVEAKTPAKAAELKQAIQKELDVAKQSGAPLLRRLEYENWLNAQIKEIDPETSFKEKALGVITSGLVSVGGIFSKEPAQAEPAAPGAVLLPQKPSLFQFNNDDVKIETLAPPHSAAAETKPKTWSGIFREAKQALADLWQASPATAQEQSNLPALADVVGDGGEVVIDNNISTLAAELNYNPVAITNYIRSNVKYEPYFGAQKGASGCLAQLICNDIDTASLTIALLRASGVPARYKHSFVRVPASQLKTLLGVDQVKTVYVALTYAGLSPKLINTSIPEGASIDTVDIEGETQLAIEWTWAEAYVEYDERGGNISFATSKDVMTGFVDDAGLRTYLSAFPKKQWISIEPLLNRSITRTRNPISVDSSSIVAKQFWLDYYQYQGASAPLPKFLADINNTNNSTYSLTVGKNDYDILPPALPYSLVASADNNANATIATAPYSVLPNTWRQTVGIALKSQDGSQTFLDKTFYASEINNQAAYLRYNGATQTDVDVIASYGGLASTPAPLAQIVPYLEFAGQLQSGAIPIHIGDVLVLETAVSLNGSALYSSQKFSTAGNEEGLFIAFSSIAPDPYLDNLDNSGLLAQGTAALARQYLQHLTDSRDTLSGALDYTASFRFMRAIVTQNRSLNVFAGFPTTFDFSGLTMDATTDVNDYSRRDNYKNHRDYFRLVFGLEASHYEGQLFTDVAGLDGIATVSGLQYAYAHPETYTVHTITSANQGEIAPLNISPNVKAQIQAGVSAGGTAVVPDKNIVKGAFQGILYALLNADNTGTYAIGEQVANGGWTTNPLLLTTWNDSESRPQYAYEYDNGPKRFIAKDNPDKIVTCSITVDNYNAVVNGAIAPGWTMANYGKPCMYDGPYYFGTHDNLFIVATDGAYFKSQSDGYNYWRTNNFIGSAIAVKASAANVTMGKIFPYWGTYAYEDKARKKMAVYNPQQLVAHSVEGKMYEKYTSSSLVINEYAPALLGYPKGSKGTANPYTSSGTEGFYQQFTNGTTYQITKNFWYDDLYVVIAGVEARHNSLNGTTGMGFPLDDPQKSFGQTNTIFQNFENGEKITYTLDTAITSVTDTAQKMSFTRLLSAKEWREFAEGVQDAFFDIGIYGVGVNLAAGATLAYVKPFVEKLVLKLGKKAATKVVIRFVPFVGWAFAGVTTGLAAYDNVVLADACAQDPDTDVNGEGEPPAYYCGRLAANTAAFAIGATLGAAKRSGKINLFGVSGDAALDGKNRLRTLIGNDKEWLNLTRETVLASPGVRTRFYERVEKLNLDENQIRTILKEPRAIKLLTSKGYYTWLNDVETYRATTLKNIPSTVQSKFTPKTEFDAGGIEHLIIGEYHKATGLFTGNGLHNPKMLKLAMDNDVVEVFKLTGEKYARFDDIKTPDGIRKVYIGQRTNPPIYKTIFPDNWTEVDTLEAVVEASSQRSGNDFTKIITKKGVTVKIHGNFSEKPGMTDLITAGSIDLIPN